MLESEVSALKVRGTLSLKNMGSVLAEGITGAQSLKYQKGKESVQMFGLSKNSS